MSFGIFVQSLRLIVVSQPIEGSVGIDGKWRHSTVVLGHHLWVWRALDHIHRDAYPGSYVGIFQQVALQLNVALVSVRV